MGWREKWDEQWEKGKAAATEGEGMNLLFIVCVVIAVIFVLFILGALTITPI